MRVTTCVYRQCNVTFLIHQRSGPFPPDSDTLRMTWSSPRDADTKTSEEDSIGSAQKVTVRRRNQRFKKIALGGARWMTRGSMRREREGELVGGCGCPSWLLLIFCKPLSASAISNHFLLLSLPFDYTHPPQHINAHQIQTSTSPILLSPRPIYSPICWPVSLRLYLAASTFPWYPPPLQLAPPSFFPSTYRKQYSGH